MTTWQRSDDCSGRPAEVILDEMPGFNIIIIGPDRFVHSGVQCALPQERAFATVLLRKPESVHGHSAICPHSEADVCGRPAGRFRTALRSGARVSRSPHRVHVPPFALRRPSNARIAGACTSYPLRSGARARIMARKEKACT